MNCFRKNRGDRAASSSPKPPPLGIKVLHDNSDATVDICFVHGLGGHRETTWTGDGQTKPWSQVFLPASLPTARVLTFGYDSAIIHLSSVASSNRLDGHAKNLLNDLAGARLGAGKSSRPLIFVAHSLGGLVCKRALLRAQNNTEDHVKKIFACARGILFLGTPHQGSWMARCAKIPVKAISFVKSANVSMLAILQSDNDHLKTIYDEFLILLRVREQDNKKIEVTCFYEELPLPGIGIVVPEESATFGGYPSLSITANHRDMARFSSDEDSGFVRVSQELSRWGEGIRNSPLQSDVTGTAAAHLALLPPEETRQPSEALATKTHGPDSRYEDIEDAHANTCAWILNTPAYMDWLNPDKLVDHHGFLWINGQPGAGKSTLMKYIYSQTEARHKQGTADGITISFFFHARGSDLEKSTLGMYRSLLHQLLCLVPGMQDVFDSAARYSKLTLKDAENYKWTVKTLERLFSAAIARLGKHRQLTCFIDALDECDEDQVRDMVYNVEQLGQAAAESGSQFYICFSSRPYPYIHVTHCERLTLGDQIGHTQDIEKYVWSKMRLGTAKAIEDVRSKILQKSSGIFLWVVLVVRILNIEFERGRIFAVQERLDAIPPELSKLFHDIVTRDGENNDSLLLCIQWILYTKSPLRKEEFYFAIVPELECGRSTASTGVKWDPKLVSPADMNRFVLSASKGLAEVTRARNPIVQFIHESVRDYLVKDGGLQSLWPELGDNFESVSHDRLKTCSLSHVLLADSTLQLLEMRDQLPQARDALRREMFYRCPFLKAAAHGALFHADAAAKDIPQGDFLMNFPREAWIGCYYASNYFSSTSRFDQDDSMLYIVTALNHTSLVTTILRRDPRTAVQGSGGHYPLLAAVKSDSALSVEALLEIINDASDINVRSSFGQTPLMIAIETKNTENYRLLLNTGLADVNAVDKIGNSPMSHATISGDMVATQLLLGMDNVDVDKADTAGRTPLMRIAEAGPPGDRHAVLQLLLESGRVNVNARDKRGRTALMHAAMWCNVKCMQVLLGIGKADATIMNNENETPLSFAIKHGMEKVVSCLEAAN